MGAWYQELQLSTSDNATVSSLLIGSLNHSYQTSLAGSLVSTYQEFSLA